MKVARILLVLIAQLALLQLAGAIKLKRRRHLVEVDADAPEKSKAGILPKPSFMDELSPDHEAGKGSFAFEGCDCTCDCNDVDVDCSCVCKCNNEADKHLAEAQKKQSEEAKIKSKQRQLAQQKRREEAELARERLELYHRALKGSKSSKGKKGSQSKSKASKSLKVSLLLYSRQFVSFVSSKYYADLFAHY